MFKIAGCFFLLLLVVGACSSKNEGKPDPVGQQPNEYPELMLTFQDGEKRSTKELKGDNILIFFQPDCRHCQIEAISIQQRLDDFKDYTLYFISSGSMEAITAFAETFDLDDKKNVRFSSVDAASVLNHYGPIQTPSVYIYSDGKLKKSFNGQTEIENILNAL